MNFLIDTDIPCNLLIAMDEYIESNSSVEDKLLIYELFNYFQFLKLVKCLSWNNKVKSDLVLASEIAIN